MKFIATQALWQDQAQFKGPSPPTELGAGHEKAVVCKQVTLMRSCQTGQTPPAQQLPVTKKTPLSLPSKEDVVRLSSI